MSDRIPTALCLSLWQPWASLLTAGRKRVETRGWNLKHRGRLLIHAAKKWDSDLEEMISSRSGPFRGPLEELGLVTTNEVRDAPGLTGFKIKLPFGCVVGQVDVVDCYRAEDVDWDGAGLDVTPSDPVWRYAPGKLRLWPEPEKHFGDYSPERFAILCENPITFKHPIPFKGHQGLFNVPLIHLPMEYR